MARTMIAVRITAESKQLFDQVVTAMGQEVGCRISQSQALEIMITQEAQRRHLPLVAKTMSEGGQ